MNIATDTSAVIAIILNEADKPAILQQTQDATLYAPLSLPWEIGNALSSLLKRSLISLSQATAAVNQYEQIPITLVEVDFLQALTLAHTYKIYAYDAYMITCAQKLQIPLLTLDKSLLRTASAAGVSIIRVR
jgi:predicted nucleic acid-binding protein